MVVPETYRAALTGRAPVYAVAHRRPGGVRTLYGVHSPTRTHLLLFQDPALADALAQGLAGYRDAHGEYPRREWSGHCDELLLDELLLSYYDEVLFETPAARPLTPLDDLVVEELRLDLLMRRQRGSGLRYTLVYDVDDAGAFRSRDYVLDDLRAAPAWLDRVAGLTSCPPGQLRDFPAPHSQSLMPPPRSRRSRRLDAPPDTPCDCEPCDDN